MCACPVISTFPARQLLGDTGRNHPQLCQRQLRWVWKWLHHQPRVVRDVSKSPQQNQPGLLDGVVLGGKILGLKEKHSVRLAEAGPML